jgi:hypothetical protein
LRRKKSLITTSTVSDYQRMVEVEVDGKRERWRPLSGDTIRGTPHTCGKDSAKLFPYPGHVLDTKRSGPDAKGIITMVYRGRGSTWFVTYRPLIDYARTDAGRKIPLSDIPHR